MRQLLFFYRFASFSPPPPSTFPAAPPGGGYVVTMPAGSGMLEAKAAMTHAMAEVGPTITAAAVSEVLALGVGAITGIPALKQVRYRTTVVIDIDTACSDVFPF